MSKCHNVAPSGVPRSILPVFPGRGRPPLPVMSVNGAGPDAHGNVSIHIPEVMAPTTDPSAAGKAADAKATGDAVSRKADKAVPQTAGNFAALDEHGNLEDSGKKPADFQPLLTFDDTPTEDSQNPVTSDGIAKAVAIVSTLATRAQETADNAGYVAQAAGAEAHDAQNQVNAVKSLIPSAATERNPLVDTATMNSSIATNTANFLGTYSYVNDLHLPQPSSAADVSNSIIALALGALTYEQTPTNNDYVFVSINYTPTTDVDEFRRFKFNGTTGTWAYEYTLNNSSFTAAQWAAINSGITSGAVEKLGALPTAAELTQALVGKMAASATGADIPVDATQGAQKISAALADKLDKSGGAADDLLICGTSEAIKFLDDMLYIFRKINGEWVAQNVWDLRTSQDGTVAFLSDVYAAVQQIAPEWVSGSPYPAYALCSYNGIVYQNGATEIPSGTTTPPNASHSGWTAKPVSGLFLPLTGGTLTGPLVVGSIESNVYVGQMDSGAELTIGHLRRAPWLLRINCYGAIHILDSNGSFQFTVQIPYKSGTLALTSDIPDVSGYAAKADSPTAGNLAALDANGNPTDSGVKASDKLDSTSAAPAFSSNSSVSYPVGSHVTYNGKLYKCTTATTGGTWVVGSWAEDTMTDPDATLDITAQNQLRAVAKDGTVLWAQGYDLASTSSATLACDACNNFTFADGATTQAFTLPTAPTGKVGDFGLDIDNSANTSAATMTLTGLDTAFSVVVPEGESLTDMLAIAAGELAQFYVTLTTFRVNNLPTWHIVKQVVENGGATV